MEHPRMPWSFDEPRSELLRDPRAALRAASWVLPVLLACALVMVPGAARAQAPAAQVPFGLTGSDAWREDIAFGVGLWVIANENARRVMLLDRCTALGHGFPGRPSPATVAASNEVFRWMTGEAHADLPPHPSLAAMRDVMRVLARHAFGAKEIASWEALRNSPQGRRGVAAREIEAALLKVSDQLTDTISGQPWGWPLARLVRLADAHGFRAELDAAFEATLGRGAAAKLRGISLVPGEAPADTQFLERVAQSGERLAEVFVKRLARSDQQAYKRIDQAGVLERWGELTQALQQLPQEPAVRVLNGVTAPSTVTKFCDGAGLQRSCQPGGELETALTKYRAAIQDAAFSNVMMKTTRQIVHGLPSSGCP